MRVLLIGATGGVGKRTLEQLLSNEQVEFVRVLVRIPAKLSVTSHPKMEVCEMKDIGKVSLDSMTQYIDGCGAVLLCIGYELSFHGMFTSGMLVLEANKLICSAIEQLKQSVKFIQVNSSGIPSPDGSDEGKRGWMTLLITKMISTTLPPFIDSTRVGQFLHGETMKHVEWCVVRPDWMLNEPHKLPIMSFWTLQWSQFAPKKTTRANCANFMCRLALEENLWQEWKFRFPIVRNKNQQ